MQARTEEPSAAVHALAAVTLDNVACKELTIWPVSGGSLSKFSQQKFK